jgi:predicted ATPase
MKCLVGLTGSHGTGKSTILQGVKQTGHRVDESQLSRAAQIRLGWPDLSQASRDAESMWQLQEAIQASMYDRDTAIEKSGLVTLVDRTPADIWGYTSLWCARLDIDTETDRRAIMYREICRRMLERYARFVYVPIMKEIPFVAEARRADAASREWHDAFVGRYLWDMAVPVHIIKTVQIDCRVAEVQAVMIMHGAERA